MSLLQLFSTLPADVMQFWGLDQLQQVTQKLQEVVQGIHGDPRCLSLLEKRRGQKGSRELQGELLRHELESAVTSLVSKSDSHVLQSPDCID